MAIPSFVLTAAGSLCNLCRSFVHDEKKHAKEHAEPADSADNEKEAE